MSEVTTPRVSKKLSLSVLSGSNVNQLNNPLYPNNDDPRLTSPSKPIKERVISESTGLVKLSLGRRDDTSAASVEKDKENHSGLKLNIPVDKMSSSFSTPVKRHNTPQLKSPTHLVSPVKTLHGLNTTESDSRDQHEILMKIAAEQRHLLELREEVKFHEMQLKQLEMEYKDLVLTQSNEYIQSSTSNASTPIAHVKQLTKKTSLIAIKNQINSSIGQQASRKISDNNTMDKVKTNSVAGERPIKGINNQIDLNSQVENIKNDITKTLNELDFNIKQEFNKSITEFNKNPLVKKFFTPSNKLKEDFSSKLNTFFKLPQAPVQKQHVYETEEINIADQLGSNSFEYSECHYLDSPKKGKNMIYSNGKYRDINHHHHNNNSILNDLNEDEEEEYLDDTSFEGDDDDIAIPLDI